LCRRICSAILDGDGKITGETIDFAWLGYPGWFNFRFFRRSRSVTDGLSKQPIFSNIKSNPLAQELLRIAGNEVANCFQIVRNSVLQKSKILIRYQSSNSHQYSKAPAEAGRSEEVVRCVANLVQKGIVSNISFNSSHVLHKKGKGYTYEVKYVRSGRSRRKRFTVYRLSVSHAKSECYQVTDPHGEYIVVKIPPQPITEITAYLEAVIHERILAKKILELGIKAVVPCISSVMRHLHKLESADSLSFCEIEDAYIELLRTPGNKFVEHLKIGDSFVFFMKFLDEPFLGKIVREFYQQDLLVNIKNDHVARDFNLIHKHNRLAFLNEYKNIGTKQSINNIYRELAETYEAFICGIDSLSKEFSLSIDHARKRDLFISNIIGKLIDESSFSKINKFLDIDNELLLRRLNKLLNETTRNPAPFKRYFELLDQEAHWLAFKYSSRKIKLIGNNLLALLAKLEETGLVLRDLKVDNLFITDLENMELGVIDLETSGYIGSGNIEGIVPAGMPGNMTVSNLLFVKQLQNIYRDGNVKEILHIQDWYATIAMMFETAIGMTLFDDARDYILKINREIDDKVASNYCDFVRNNPGVEVTSEMIERFFMLSDEEIKGHTWYFFALAKRDFKKKSLEYSFKLKEIMYCLPNALQQKISAHLDIHLKRIHDHYRSCRLNDISSDFLDISNLSIDVLKKKLVLKEQLYDANKANPLVNEATKIKLAIEIDTYKDCIALKQKENLLIKKRYVLNQEQISALSLFPIMLDLIVEVMCQDEWRKYHPKYIATSSGKEWENEQIIGGEEDWKSTIVPTKKELAQWAKKSRELGFNNAGFFCPSSNLAITAGRNSDEKTLKNSILFNLKPKVIGKL
jgi:hypothetical protein